MIRGRRSFGLVLVALALAVDMGLVACSGGAETIVHVTVRYPAAWGLDRFDWRIGDDAVTTAASGQARILLAGERANVPLALTLLASRGAERYAAGRAQVTPRPGAMVEIEIFLARLPCGAWCSPGATTCFGDSVAVCEERDGDDCPEWSDPVVCSPDAPYCSLGACAATCVDECAAGETRCVGPGAVQVCGNSDNDPCRDWGQPLTCEGGEVCASGQCAATCSDECPALGATTCEGGGVATCDDRNFDGCREWGPVVACSGGTSCSDGVCSTTCTDECSASSCDGMTFRACGQFDLDACLDKSPGTSCVTQNPCVESACTATGCATAPKVCMNPPGSMCVGSETLRVYDQTGSCQSDGTCLYAQSDVACPNCPSCDACASVTCTTPPAPAACYQPVGTCTDGACSYAYADGASCDDGNACTSTDTCASGVCAGTPLACTMPPAPVCLNASVLRSFVGAGSCTGGLCSYPHVDTVCAGGCQAGACASTCPTACAAEVFGTSTGFALWAESGYAADATHVYWVSSDEIRRRNKSGGPVETVVIDHDGPKSIAVDDTDLYWGTDSSIKRKSKIGGGSTAVLAMETGVSGLALDANTVVFTYSGVFGVGGVKRVAKTGGQVTTLTDDKQYPFEPRLDGTHVYFGRNTDNGMLSRVKLAGGSSEVVVTPETDYTLDGTDIFYVRDEMLYRSSKASPGRTPFLVVGGIAVSVAVDADNVYWITEFPTNDYHIGRSKKTDAKVIPILTETGHPFGLTVDDGYLYWVRLNGQLMRAPLCACGL
jgi:hypothetical protein